MSSIEQNANGAPSKKGLTATQIILIVGMVLILGALAGVGYMLYRTMQKEEPVSTVSSYVIDEGNVEDVQAQLKKRVDEGRFETNMNLEWFFPDTTQPSANAYVANDQANSKPFFY